MSITLIKIANRKPKKKGTMTKYISTDMSPAEIRYRLDLAGWTQAALARDLKLSPPSIYQVISGRSQSERVMRRLSEIIEIPVERIRPSIYMAGGRKLGRPYSDPTLHNQ